MLRRIGSLACVAAAVLAAGVDAAEPPRPNVLVILADDLGFSDLGSYGGEIDTPHLDALAAGGLRFTQGYSTARCWPSRAALLTGYYPQAVGRDALPGGGSQGVRPPWARLLPDRLAPAGYRSYHSGKWHVDGDPREQGFVRSLLVDSAAESNYFTTRDITADGQPVPETQDTYVTTLIGDHAVRCLREHAARHPGTPFFQFVAFTAPHFPLHAPADLVAKYRGRYRAGWDAVRAARIARLATLRIVTAPPAAIERGVGPPYPMRDMREKLGPHEVDRPLPWAGLSAEQQAFQAEKMAIHAAMVEAMDREVGRIVGELKASGAFADTFILFASDNGASAEIMVRGAGHDPAAPPGSRQTFLCLGPGWSSCANAPFRRHKTWVHEGGIATPWIVHWPRGGAAAGELRRPPVHLVDVTPTVLELAGVEPPRGPDGRPAPPWHGKSFLGALARPDAAVHDELWWCHDGHRALRAGDWKLVAERRGAWELYDLAADRCEMQDLAAGQPARVRELEARWQAIAAGCRRMAAEDGAGAAPRPAVIVPVPRGASFRDGELPSVRRPNIVYVMTDDQGYGDIAAHGNPVVRTPRIDRLHAQSVRFTEFHASPTCAATRAALLTGRHEFRSGVTHTLLERERLALSATTLPQLLRASGYATGIFGKWHLGDEDAYQPGRRGFDRAFIHGGGGIGQSHPGSCGDAPFNSYFNPWVRSDGTFVKTQGYCTDVFFTAALEWIDTCRRRQAPFCCFLMPNAPHEPLDCPMGSDAPYRQPLEAAGIADARQRARIAKFYGMIENIDANLGRLLDRLDEWGLAEDTLVVFTTDNGTATGEAVWNAGMRGKKGTPWRGGTRVPAFWRWPTALPARVDVPAVVAHIDVLPTLCDLAGAEIPPAVEGRSLVPLLHDPLAPWPDRTLVTHVGRWEQGEAGESARRNCRIRQGRWSLLNAAGDPAAWQLYDLVADPGESHDVAADHAEIVGRLAAAYDEWWSGVRPALVNEERPGPAQNPYAAAFRRQFTSQR